LAEAHERDLQVQDEFGVRFLTYWFDRERGSTYCLVDAPDAQSVEKVHAKAHGNVPTEVIEVNLDEVRAFLGRTEDPPVADDQVHPLVDSAHRVIMFTDLQDSTGLSVFVGDVRAIELLGEHDRIIRDAVLENNGNVVKHTGDGFLISFTTIADCLNSAVAIQRSFEAFNEQVPEVPLKVKIGINAGEPMERQGDLFGMVVQMSSRICGVASPGQILVSGVIPELLGDGDDTLTFVETGAVPLKGFMGAPTLYELVWKSS
jgi:class 3 adenylate cyclase